MGLAVRTLREKLHQYIDYLEDKKVKAFYTIVQNDIKDDISEYTDAFKDTLNERYADYKSGKSKMITATESTKRVHKILKDKFKK